MLFLRALLPGYRKPDYLCDDIEVTSIPVFKLPRSYKCLGWDTLVVHEVVRSGFNPDIVLTHEPTSLLFGLAVAKRRHLPLIAGVHTHDLLAYGEKSYRRLWRPVYEYASAIACRSPMLQHRFSCIHPEMANKTFPALSGIDSCMICPEQEVIDKAKDIRSSSMRISFVTVSRLVSREHIATVIRSLSEIGNSIGDWEYRIIGDGPEKNNLMRVCKELKVERNVCFLGQLERTEVLAQLRESHVFVLVSSDETFGLVYLEAMASGCLVFAARGEGIDGIIRDGENGFLSSSGDVKKTFPMACAGCWLKELRSTCLS